MSYNSTVQIVRYFFNRVLTKLSKCGIMIIKGEFKYVIVAG